MKIEKVIDVSGRGFVFIGTPNKEVRCGDKIMIGNASFKITGIESASNTKRKGFILSPNKLAYINIQKGDEVEIVSK